VNSQRFLAVFREARSLLTRPGNDFSCSSWEDSAAALREIDALIAQLEAGSPPDRLELTVLFAPTGPIQEVSSTSGWAEEFLALAERFDAALGAP
jgi:hypothetical protein